MSVQTFNYNINHNFDIVFNAPANSPQMTQAQAQTGIQNSTIPETVNQQFIQEFAKQLSGHYFRVNNTTVTVTSLSIQVAANPNYGVNWTYEAKGSFVTNFDTDIADPSVPASTNTLLAVVIGILGIIGGIFLAATGVGALVLGIYFVGLTISCTVLVCSDAFNSMVNTSTGAITQLGSNAGSLILTLAILGVAALGIYAMFFTKKGKQATSKAYKTARGAYRKVRGR